ncbi:MAG: DUF2066 domain-containing protein [Rhodanobacter sp.]|nr:MAG: DUF2066 domain-containing protein [Rhodanobacter sp.]TAM13298.1 MAG: DUF2066 domain-containing protein [Rhodanobacter sp.]TAM35418.1 MAG: DUF2066 domain-containing protein [Rhodanobacter sp.]
MRLLVLLALSLVAGLAAWSTASAQAASPYVVTVPVSDTSNAQRSDAFSTALAQVLARVAGGQDLRSEPGYADALKDAAALVRHFQYARAATGMSLTVDFEPGAVRHLVQRLGVTNAATGKPPLLVLVQGTDGVPLNQGALASLAGAAAARGYEIAYAAAANAPDLDKLAAADPATLAAINQQYHTGLVLAGKLHAGSADWLLVAGGKVQRWNDKGATEDAMLAAAGTGAVDRISRQLNVVGASVGTYKLWVGGLDSAMDYANLVHTVRADPSVRSLVTLGADNDGMLFQVKAAMPAAALAANLAASGRVIRTGSHAGTDASLRWLHGEH